MFSAVAVRIVITIPYNVEGRQLPTIGRIRKRGETPLLQRRPEPLLQCLIVSLEFFFELLDDGVEKN